MAIPLKMQSALLALFVYIINGGLVYTIIRFNHYWYCFIAVMALGALSTIYYTTMILLHAIFTLGRRPKLTAPDEPFMMLVTAYRETKEEVNRTVASLIEQKISIDRQKVIVVIVDGEKETAQFIHNEPHHEKRIIKNAYKDWYDESRDLTIYTDIYLTHKIVYIIKSENSGKRDSVALIRTLAYGRLMFYDDDRYAMDVSGELETTWAQTFEPVTRIFGIDADSTFAPECIQAMLEEMSFPGKRPVDGVVGYIEIDEDPNHTKNPYQTAWRWFQSLGYVVGQHVMRVYQSRITEKVSCLSGASYGILVKTMCEPNLLREFNKPPPSGANLFHSILSFASEDRRAVVLSLCRDRCVRFRQALDKRAICYTVPPENLTVYLSQRRRWSLGTLTNNLWLVLYGHKLYISERIVALTQIVAWLFTPMYAVVNVFLIYIFATRFRIMIIYISIPMFMVYFINLCIPLWSPAMGSFRNRIKFYPKMAISFSFGAWLALLVQANSMINSHRISWGKTTVKTVVKN